MTTTGRAQAFDHNDHAMRARCAEAYEELRDHCPVSYSDAWGGFWVASRYEDVYEVVCKPLPMLLITRLLGIERDEAFWAWTDTLIYGRVDGTDAGEIRAAA